MGERGPRLRGFYPGCQRLPVSETASTGNPRSLRVWLKGRVSGKARPQKDPHVRQQDTARGGGGGRGDSLRSLLRSESGKFKTHPDLTAESHTLAV